MPAEFVEEAGKTAENRIGPGDLLTITVFQVKDLDREVRVSESGRISLPLIGALLVSGRSVQELESDIANRYGQRYLQNPQVTVFVKEYVSRRVTVEGAVKKSGIYPMQTRTTLVQAVAMAEGLTDIASARDVMVFRESGSSKLAARFDLKAIREGASEDPVLAPNDIVVVSKSNTEVWLTRFIQMMPLLSTWIIYKNQNSNK